MIYHIYTPLNFKKTKKYPILIAFSPVGNGLAILNKLKESSEKQGWILIGCDQLKNGIKDVDLEIRMEDEVLNDLFKNLPYQKSKIYLAGFSGGAMRAYQLTTRRKETIKGIIAFGGWLGGKSYQSKEYQKRLRVAMVNGVKDKGANKWVGTDSKTLQKHKAKVRVFTHIGGHQIAPKNVIDNVFTWMTSCK